MPVVFDAGIVKPYGSAVRSHAITQKKNFTAFNHDTTSRNADGQPSDECFRLAPHMSHVPLVPGIITTRIECLGMKAPGHGDHGDLERRWFNIFVSTHPFPSAARSRA